MSYTATYHLNLIIDTLTDSIRHIESGISFQTELSLASQKDMKLVTRRNRWHFNWKSEFKQNDRLVYKLTKVSDPETLQGLISLSDMQGYVYIHLAESAPINFGETKEHEGVGGNLFAYGCKRSWDNGNEGFISFQAKTKLINHYEKILGAVNSGGNNMIVYPQEALFLINKYFKA